MQIKKVSQEEFDKLKYRKELSGYKKCQSKHKVFVIRKSKNPAYGIVIPRNIIQQFNILDVYYNLNIEASGARLILTSGCKFNEDTLAF